MKSQIKLIIFDCYGPILSSGYPDTIKVLSKRYHIPKKELMAIIYAKYFNQAALRKISQREAWQKAIDYFQLPLTSKQLQTLHIGLLRLNPVVFQLAKSLRKKYQTLLLSKNTRVQFAATKKRFPQVWKSFDAVINTWELNLPKASQQTINEICRRFKVRPAEILYTDDQRDNLVQARKMGVKTIFYKNPAQLRKELFNYLK